METTFQGYILILGLFGIMENKMETTIIYLGGWVGPENPFESRKVRCGAPIFS